MTDWRADILTSLPEDRRLVRCMTFATGLELIQVAAYNRRMTQADFIGRAALAVACYDADEPWAAMTRLEPPINDIRRGLTYPPKRMYGRGHGEWQITGMT